MSLVRFLVFLGVLGAAAARAEKTSFKESQVGLLIQTAYYFPLVPNMNRFDPVPGLAPEGLTTGGTDAMFLRNYKFGLYGEALDGRLLAETYIIYMGNSKVAPWTASGAYAGSGTTTFRGWGGGLGLAGTFVQYDIFRVQMYFNGEYVMQGAKLRFTTSDGIEQALDLSATAMLAGGGLRAELRLADMWILSVSAGYQYGMPGTWAAVQPATFFSTAQTGALKDPKTGEAIPAEFGGFTAEAGLRLNF